jgi:hypothetical protein
MMKKTKHDILVVKSIVLEGDIKKNMSQNHKSKQKLEHGGVRSMKSNDILATIFGRD